MTRGCANLLILAAVMAASLCACSSDRQLVANAAATYTYQEWKYEDQCMRPTTAPQNCLRRYEALKKLKDLTTICNDTQKIGKLPKEAKKDLKEAQDGLDIASRPTP